MITARGLIGGESGITTRRTTPEAAKQPQQTLTVRRRVKTSPGDMYATVTFEAVDQAGAVVRAESLRTRQPVMISAIIPRQQDFVDGLAAEGYAVKV